MRAAAAATACRLVHCAATSTEQCAAEQCSAARVCGPLKTSHGPVYVLMAASKPSRKAVEAVGLASRQALVSACSIGPSNLCGIGNAVSTGARGDRKSLKRYLCVRPVRATGATHRWVHCRPLQRTAQCAVAGRYPSPLHAQRGRGRGLAFPLCRTPASSMQRDTWRKQHAAVSGGAHTRYPAATNASRKSTLVSSDETYSVCSGGR